jgi:hypothetical protein
MGRSRNLADLLDANGDVKSGSLDNVPPSNDASALTTGTLSADRLAAGSIGAAKLAETYLTPTGDGSGLTGLSSSSSKITVELESGTSLTAGGAVSLSPNGKAANYPTLNTVGDEVSDTALNYNAECPDGQTRIRLVGDNPSDQTRVTIYGQYINPTTLTATEHATSTSMTANGGVGSPWQSPIGVNALGNNYFVVYVGNTRSNNAYSYSDIHMCMIKVNPSTGAITKTSEKSYAKDWGSSNAFAYPNFGMISKNHFLLGSSNNGAGYNVTTFYYYNYGTDQFENQNSLGSSRIIVNNGAFKKHHISADNSAIFYCTGNEYRKQPTQNSGKGVQNNSWTATTLRTDYSNNAQHYFPDSTHLIYYYKNVNSVFVFVLYSIANNGDLTELDTYEVGTTNVWNSGFMSVGSSYKQLIFSGVGGFRTLLIDANDNFVGLGVPVTYYGDNGGGFKIDDTTFVVKGSGTNGRFYRRFTVNAYQTDPFEYMGISNDTASSGSAELTVAGVKDGYTGLTVGATYYISDAYDGTINTDSTKGTPKVGKAISSTEILMAEIS